MFKQNDKVKLKSYQHMEYTFVSYFKREGKDKEPVCVIYNHGVFGWSDESSLELIPAPPFFKVGDIIECNISGCLTYWKIVNDKYTYNCKDVDGCVGTITPESFNTGVFRVVFPA